MEEIHVNFSRLDMPDLEKETLKLYSKIEKYANEGNTSLMSDLLTTLKKQPMTVDVLRDTKVGRKVNQLRQKIDDKEIKQQMKNLINKITLHIVLLRLDLLESPQP